MVHTFEVQISLNYLTYCYLIENIPGLSTVNKYICRSNYYSKKGISQIELIKYVSDDKSINLFFLKLRCNLSIIMGESDILILDENKYSVDEMLKQFRKRIYEVNEFRYIKLHTYTVDEFSVNRVDFAKDILVDDPSLVTYLCNMSMPNNFRRLNKTKINKSTDVLYSESCHYKSNSRTINIYSKYKAILNSNKKPPPEIEHLLKKILRIEIQVNKNGLKNLNKKLGKKITLNQIFDKDFCNNYLINEISMIFSSNKYVSFDEVVKIINNSNYKDKKKKVLISILRSIINCNGLDNLIKNIKNSNIHTPRDYGGERKFKGLIKDIHDLGIQSAVIPNEYGLNEFPSICTLLNETISHR